MPSLNNGSLVIRPAPDNAYKPRATLIVATINVAIGASNVPLGD
ncbi:MAG: hypothetical protein AAGJ37_11235 [Pseudomonadota bacterium]